MKNIFTKKGFTLIEMTVVIVLLGTIGIVVATMIVRSFQSYRFSQDTMQMQEAAAKVMRDFEKTARGGTQVLTSDPDTYEFYTYLLNDLQPAPSKVRYFVQNGVFEKGITEPSGPGPIFNYLIANENVEPLGKYVINGGALFKYYNDASNKISEPVPADAVRMVQITVTVDKDTSKKPDPITETTKVNLRNLKTNL
jgi:prepilin-type N-terminal cleavage/methylation domain-containing protein